jgi:hypothetical protein
VDRAIGARARLEVDAHLPRSISPRSPNTTGRAALSSSRSISSSAKVRVVDSRGRSRRGTAQVCTTY